MNYTLQLFDHLLAHSPIGLSLEVITKAKQKVASLREQNVSEEDAEIALIFFGKEAWPYWQAEQKFLDSLGNKKELFINALSSKLQEKWNDFENTGGDMHDYRNGQKFEEAFTPEENIQIEKAMIDSSVAAHDQMRELVSGEKSEEYAQLVSVYSKERDQIILKFEELILVNLFS